jgi:23S rRNA (uracil1939-C5)-methyltransferase
MQVECKYKDKCSGCQYLGVPLKEQHQRKRAELSGLLQRAQIPFKSDIQVINPAPAGLRDRVDLVWEAGSLGLYAKYSQGAAKQVLDIERCEQLSPALQTWLEEVRKIRWPIRKGSLRLRVGPQGQRGIWLDFANVDVKALLDERTLLMALISQAVVEIGQRHKVLNLADGVLKLKDPVPRVWFQSFIEGRAVDLFCSIGTFTQPGVKANVALTKVISDWLEEVQAREILEFGSGIGNLSFPALGRDRRLVACEIDEEALAGFKKSLEALSSQQPEFADISARVKIQRGDFQNRHPQDFKSYDTVLVNPPRSGLKNFLAPLIEESRKPENFLYMSCFPESFIADAAKLTAAGYELHKLTIVDQFPQTTHYEVLSLWRLCGLDAF